MFEIEKLDKEQAEKEQADKEQAEDNKIELMSLLMEEDPQEKARFQKAEKERAEMFAKQRAHQVEEERAKKEHEQRREGQPSFVEKWMERTQALKEEHVDTMIV